MCWQFLYLTTPSTSDQATSSPTDDILSAKTLLSTAVGWHVSVFTITTSHISLLKTSPQQSAGFNSSIYPGSKIRVGGIDTWFLHVIEKGYFLSLTPATQWF